MEIYKASINYHIEFAPQISDSTPPRYWKISSMPSADRDGPAWVIHRDVVECPPDAILSEDELYITKQRGGIREFRSLDAAARAVEEIGQLDVVVVFQVVTEDESQ